MPRIFRQKDQNEIEDSNNTMNPLDLKDNSRTFSLTTSQYTFFLGEHGTFSKIDHLLGHKTTFSSFLKIKSYKVSSLIKMEWGLKSITERTLENSQCVEMKQYS